MQLLESHSCRWRWLNRLRFSMVDLGMPKLRGGCLSFPPRSILIAMGLLLVSSLTAVPLVAQGETTSAIVGSVSDPAGAAIAGATVTITSTDTAMKRSAKTDEAGRFNFPQLRPGSYSVRAEADMFEAQQNRSE